MNHKTIIQWSTAIITTGILTAGSAVYAQEADPDTPNEDRRARFLERYDVNGDGEVTRDEIQQVRAQAAAARVAAFIERYDLDGDEAITEAELVLAATESAAEHQAGLLERFDLNSDGNITQDEALSVHEALVDERVGAILDRLNGIEPEPNPEDDAVDGRRPRRPNRGSLRRLDLNDDGEVTEAEVLEAGATMVIDLQARFNERYDTNSDGTISTDELANVGEAAIMERIAELLERMDDNGDGQITADEVNLGRGGQGRPQRRPQGNRPGNRRGR